MKKIICILLIIALLVGCSPQESSQEQIISEDVKKALQNQEEIVIKQITLNLCQKDIENADYWRKVGINLLNRPGGKLIENIPACSNIKVDVLTELYREEDQLTFYKIRYGDVIGWQTVRLLEKAPKGEEW